MIGIFSTGGVFEFLIWETWKERLITYCITGREDIEENKLLIISEKK